MDPNKRIDGSIGLKNLHVNTLIDPIEFDLTGISSFAEDTSYSFVFCLQ